MYQVLRCLIVCHLISLSWVNQKGNSHQDDTLSYAAHVGHTCSNQLIMLSPFDGSKKVVDHCRLFLR